MPVQYGQGIQTQSRISHLTMHRAGLEVVRATNGLRTHAPAAGIVGIAAIVLSASEGSD